MITGREVLVDVAAFSQGPRHCFDVPNTAAATPVPGRSARGASCSLVPILPATERRGSEWHVLICVVFNTDGSQAPEVPRRIRPK